MLKAIINYFKSLFSSASQAIESKTHQIETSNKNNLDFNKIIADYQTQTNKELKTYHDLVDTHRQQLIMTQEKKDLEEKALNKIVSSIKVAEKKKTEVSSNEALQIDLDITTLKNVATNKLRLIKAYTSVIEKQEQGVHNLCKTISNAELQVQNNLTALQIASIENSVTDLNSLIRNPSINSNIDIQEILDIVNGKKCLVQAQEENDKILNRNDVVLDQYQSSEQDKELQDMLENLLKA